MINFLFTALILVYSSLNSIDAVLFLHRASYVTAVIAYCVLAIAQTSIVLIDSEASPCTCAGH